MMKILVIIDVQEDYIRGSLANPLAEKIIPAIKERIIQARENHEMVIFTMDTHSEDYLKTLEGEKLPIEHCIYQTDGWQIVNEIKDYAALCILKSTFGSIELINRIEMIKKALDEEVEIEVCGVVSSSCVLANCVLLRAAMPNAKIVVNKNLIADISEANQQAALLCLKAQHIDIIE